MVNVTWFDTAGKEATTFFLGSLLLTAGIFLFGLTAGFIPTVNAWEFVGCWFNFACVGLAARQNMWTWYFGIVAVLVLAVVFWQNLLYGSMVLNLLYFLPLQFLGIYQWKFGGENRTKLQPSALTRGQYLTLAGGAITAWLVVYYVHVALGGAISGPDSAILVGSILAQYLLNIKKVENWFIWIGVNAFSLYTYFAAGLFLLGTQYVFFLLFAFYGYYAWRKNDQALTAS